MVASAFFLLAVALAPAATFVLPIKEKDDGLLHVEDISLGGTKNLGLLEKLKQDLKNSFAVVVEEFNSGEDDNSVTNIRKIYKDDDSDDMKDKNIPGEHNECADGMIYLSELDICVPYNSSPPLPPTTRNIYDIPQGDAPFIPLAVVSEIQFTHHKFNKDHDCKDGEIYLSELDICAPENQADPLPPLPPKARVYSIYDIPQGDAPAKLVEAEDSNESSNSKEYKSSKTQKNNHGCRKGEIYLSELDICVQQTTGKPLPPKPAPSIYDIPQGDSPQAVFPVAELKLQVRHKTYNKGNNKHWKGHGCGKGEFYLSELDICVPIAIALATPIPV